MIFLDSGYYIGLLDKKDIHHKDCIQIRDNLAKSHETTVINTTVLVETLNRSVGTGENVKKLHEDLNTENMVISLTKSDYLRSLEINGWYGNSINYSDCTIMTTMMDMGITKIVSFDGCFEKIGKFDVISDKYGVIR